jgi:2-(1,2-epoxy-1,2-dihydrophenyl)acetyl-CoA isomerase
MDSEILADRDGAVLRLTLNRPDRLNAFTAGLHAALRDHLQRASEDPEVRAVLLSGAGRGFCAGQDLAEVTPETDLGGVLETRFNPLVMAVRTLPKPVVCAVHGAVAGAGASLALACDVVVAGESAVFRQAFVQIGLVPDAGGTWVLPRLVGDARARAMAMLGEPVDGRTAEAWGMVWKTVPDAALLDEAGALAARLAALPTQAIRLMKAAFLASATNGLEAQLALERDLQREAGATPDYAEGVRAFLEKRRPAFTGRRA